MRDLERVVSNYIYTWCRILVNVHNRKHVSSFLSSFGKSTLELGFLVEGRTDKDSLEM